MGMLGLHSVDGNGGLGMTMYTSARLDWSAVEGWLCLAVELICAHTYGVSVSNVT
jgi:hypothetical protein